MGVGEIASRGAPLPQNEHMIGLLFIIILMIGVWFFLILGMAPLHQAVLNGNILAVSLLISHGADVNKPDEDTWTPLHAACSEGHLEIVRYVISGRDWKGDKP